MTTGWPTYGHDTGHTNVNDGIGGPVDLDQKWELRVNVQNQPVVRNGRIYASCSNRQVRAFSVDGDRLWTYHHPRPEEFSQLNVDHHAYRCRATSPAVDGDAVYHVLDDRCVSLNVSDGTERWSTLLPTEEGSLLGGALQLGPKGRLYVAYTDGIHVLESHSGSVLWSESTRSLRESPVIDARGRYLLYEDDDYVIRALDATSGRSQWRYSSSGDDTLMICRITADGAVVLGRGGGQFRALDVETGDRRWTVSGEYSILRFLPHSPSNHLFAKTDDDRLQAIDLVNGTVRWSVGLEPDEGFPIRGTNQYLYLQKDERIVRRNPRSGAVEERSPSVGFEIRDFVVTRDAVVVAGDMSDLSLLGGRNSSPTNATDTTVYESDNSGTLGNETQVFDGIQDPSYCPNCGTDLSKPDDPNYCPACGIDL